MVDDFVKSPSAALRFVFRHCDVQQVRLVPQDSRALHLELFTVSSFYGLFTSPSWFEQSYTGSTRSRQRANDMVLPAATHEGFRDC